MTVRPYPSRVRAVHQLDRHSSGTPNTPPAQRPMWAENLAAFSEAMSISAAAVSANLRAWYASGRLRQ